MRGFGVPVVVALNRFASDTDAELSVVAEICRENQADFALCEHFAKGGAGALDLAKKVEAVCRKPSGYKPLYELELPIKAKIEAIATKIYGAAGVVYTGAAEKGIKDITALGKDKLPICMAKTQYSLSDDPNLLGRPTDYELTVREVRLSAGAGFIVALTGEIMTMPGLPKVPAAEKIDIDAQGTISGLF
jgi:formate--tetrahydrofolate ligase